MDKYKYKRRQIRELNEDVQTMTSTLENLQRDEHDAKLQAVGTTQTPATVTVEAPAVGFTTTFNVSFGEVSREARLAWLTECLFLCVFMCS